MNNEASISTPVTRNLSNRARRATAIAVKIFKGSSQLLLFVGLVLASYLLISHFVLQTVQVVGASMVPTLHDADRYFLNRWAYYLHTPRHSDIVVVKDPSDGVFVVKRIIATPGESIYFKKGEVFVNGSKLKEPYLVAGTPTFTCNSVSEALIMCGKDQYFLLGDNRNNSFDSRMYGPVQRQNILGALIR